MCRWETLLLPQIICNLSYILKRTGLLFCCTEVLKSIFWTLEITLKVVSFNDTPSIKNFLPGVVQPISTQLLRLKLTLF